MGRKRSRRNPLTGHPHAPLTSNERDRLERCGVPKAIHNPACHACADQSASDPHWTSEPACNAPRAALESRFSDLSEFVRKIAEGEEFFSAETGVGGQRAIELTAWELYRKLQESHDL